MLSQIRVTLCGFYKALASCFLCTSCPVLLLSSGCLLAFQTHPLSVPICGTSPLLPKSHCKAYPPCFFLPFLPSSAFRFQLFLLRELSLASPLGKSPHEKLSHHHVPLLHVLSHVTTFIQVCDHAHLPHVYAYEHADREWVFLGLL